MVDIKCPTADRARSHCIGNPVPVTARVQYKLAPFKKRNKAAAFDTLRTAYEESFPNDIVMPFIELGKDMRTLIASFMREGDGSIPKEWLESINKRAALYAKYQVQIIADYKKETGITGDKPLSSRETEILHDLCAGLSLSDIAVKQCLSISTVKMNINHIETKLNTHGTANIIRDAIEKNLL